MAFSWRGFWRVPTSGVAVASSLLAIGCGSDAAHSPNPSRPIPPLPASALAALSPDIGEPVLAPTEASLELLVGGDVIPHRPRLSHPAQLARALRPMAPLFAKSKNVLLNLEAALGDPTAFPVPGTVLMASSAWVDELPHAHVTGVSLANNHACDLGAAALLRTLEAAQTASLKTVGTSLGDPFTPEVIAESGGHRICAIAWTALMNNAGRPSACELSGRVALASSRDRASENRIREAINRAPALGCEAVVAIIHGGVEYTMQTREIRRQAMAAAEAGAAAVLVHHPHVPSPVEVVTTSEGREVPILLSLGNFVSNQGESWRPELGGAYAMSRPIHINGWTRLGLLAHFRWEWRTRTSAPQLRWGYHLVWNDNEHAEHPEFADPAIAVRLLDDATDRAIVDALAHSRTGPASLFVDLCRISGDNDPVCRVHRTPRVPADGAVAVRIPKAAAETPWRSWRR